MKKLLNKVRRKKAQEPPSRITNETIAEHRERILAGGRKFKYPIQYARRRLIVVAGSIAVATIVLLIAFFWWQLYIIQNTSEFMYRVTRVIPVPVASVDGQQVRYSDFLMKYRSSIHYLQEKEQVSLKSDDGKRQAAYVKQQAMDDAIADAYAMKRAKELNITVSDNDVEAFLKLQRQSSDGEVSQQTYDAVVLDYYDWTPDEYREATRVKLLRQKVMYAVDERANKTVETIKTALASQKDFKTVVDASNQNKDLVSAIFTTSGLVPKTNQDGGLAVAAAKLQIGTVSDVIKSTSGEGYYFVKPVESNETQINYDAILIPLTEFDAQLSAIKTAKNVKEYISVPRGEQAAS